MTTPTPEQLFESRWASLEATRDELVRKNELTKGRVFLGRDEDGEPVTRPLRHSEIYDLEPAEAFLALGWATQGGTKPLSMYHTRSDARGFYDAETNRVTIEHDDRDGHPKTDTMTLEQFIDDETCTLFDELLDKYCRTEHPKVLNLSPREYTIRRGWGYERQYIVGYNVRFFVHEYLEDGHVQRAVTIHQDDRNVQEVGATLSWSEFINVEELRC